ncbi:Crp/Fnr family transcriptional regulator [Rhizobacter sp. Root1221]|uniref:Crp/Fnr family transcriptional regulator n=1 Tax=Rhizobacter sp. Root1221 TaxID=1736433 RepID=UPI0006F78C73|nr:Crp/Fnr family transcriptional regulator [Rhizobacter sp. Root1221]KQW01296.1 Crp/Fnr family transcriptional regulator [Rhizobacter sp. Root1221]
MPSTPEPTVLQGNPWFVALPARERAAMLAAAETLAVPAGEMVYRQGDGGGAFYAVLDGSLKLSTLHADGRESILAIMEAGNWFGEVALVDGSLRTHDVTALSACRLLAVPAAVFAACMDSAPFARAVAVLLASRVRGLYGLIDTAAPGGLRSRVARRLLSLAHGDTTPSAVARRTVTLPQESLAMMLGISRQTLSKELKALAGDGAISVGYGRIDILSMPMLERGAQA